MTVKILALSFYLGLALLFCAAIIPAQDSKEDAKNWYPLAPGDTWTYQKESLDGDVANPNVERWTTEETITSTVDIPELAGILVTKSIKVLSDVLSAGFLPENDWAKREQSQSHLFIRQNCIYLLDGPDARGASSVQVSDTESVSALDDANQFHPAYWDELIRGNVPADFCFPLAKGTTWGKVPSTSPAEEYVWHVIGFNADPFGPPDSDTYHLRSYLGSGDVIDRWFEEGFGIVQEDEEHHGTYDESRRLLLSATIDGKTQTYQLTPARTVPVSGDDCDGPRWQHFARVDGTPFQDMADCVNYSSASDHLR